MRVAATIAAMAVLAASCSSATMSDDSPTLRAGTLECGKWIEQDVTLPDVYADILGVVALPTSASAPQTLQVSEGADAPRAERFFAKTGLVVTPGEAFTIEIAGEQVGRVAMGSSDSGSVEQLSNEPCPTGSGWVAYAGGFVVAEPVCVRLLVRAGDRVEMVEVGVGAPCSGQAPPP